MKKYILLLLAGSVCGVASSQNVYSLEQCRQLALSQNIKMTEAGRLKWPMKRKKKRSPIISQA